MFCILRLADEVIVRRYDALPKSFEVVINGRPRRIISPVTVGDEGLGYRFCELVTVNFDRPGTYFTQGSDSQVFDNVNSRVTLTRSWTAWTPAEVTAYEDQQAANRAAQLEVSEDVLRAVALIFNERVNAIFAAVAASSSLADLRNRMATAAAAGGSMTAAELKAEVTRRVRAT